MTMENSAVCVFFLIKYGDSVVLVILTAVFFQFLLGLRLILTDTLLP